LIRFDCIHTIWYCRGGDNTFTSETVHRCVSAVHGNFQHGSIISMIVYLRTTQASTQPCVRKIGQRTMPPDARRGRADIQPCCRSVQRSRCAIDSIQVGDDCVPRFGHSPSGDARPRGTGEQCYRERLEMARPPEPAHNASRHEATATQNSRPLLVVLDGRADRCSHGHSLRIVRH